MVKLLTGDLKKKDLNFFFKAMNRKATDEVTEGKEVFEGGGN